MESSQILYREDIISNIQLSTVTDSNVRKHIGLCLRLMCLETYVAESDIKHMHWFHIATSMKFPLNIGSYHYSATSSSLLIYVIIRHLYPDVNWIMYKAYSSTTNEYIPYFRSNDRIIVPWHKKDVFKYDINMTNEILGSEDCPSFTTYIELDPRYKSYASNRQALLDHLQSWDIDDIQSMIDLKQPFRHVGMEHEMYLSYSILKIHAMKVCNYIKS